MDFEADTDVALEPGETYTVVLHLGVEVPGWATSALYSLLAGVGMNVQQVESSGGDLTVVFVA